MLRVSTTTIEQYRRLMVYDYVQESSMIAKIRGIHVEPTQNMLVGTAWHSVLEEYENIVSAEKHAELIGVNPNTIGDGQLFNPTAGVSREDFVQHKCHVFNRHHVAAARDKIGKCLWEVKGNRIFDTPYGPCNVIAKADNVWGLRVQDTKVKFDKPDGKDWEHDLQWRFYLLVHGAEMFRYNAFTFREPKEFHDTPGIFDMTMTDYIAFNFFRYDAMEDDCMTWLNDFLGWADSNELMPFLHREPKD